MSWNTKLLKYYGFNNDFINNRRIFLKLFPKNINHHLIKIDNLNKKLAEEHWKDTLDISKKLLEYIYITDIDQYYYKILRILRYVIFNIILKTKFILRSYNKQLRYDYKCGENNIINKFVENISLKDGVWVPYDLQYVPNKLIKENNIKIKKTFKI